MTGEIKKPSDLAPLKTPLTEAVINAYMAKNVTGTGGLTFDHGSCEEGEFRFKIPVDWSRDPKFYVSYPDGEWKRDDWLSPDPEIDGSDPNLQYYDVSTFDAPAVWQEIRDMVAEWIDPFIEGRDPGDLSDQITNISAVIDQLYVQDEVRIDGNPVTLGNEEGKTSVPVTDIQSCIKDMASEVGDLSGLAIDALEKSYINDVGLTISGQRALAIVAGIAIAGEATAWNNVYADLYTFFTNATADFNSYAQSHGASGQGAVQVLSVISGVAGVASGASAAVAPLSGTLAVVSGVASIGAALWPTEEAVEPTEIVLKGGSFNEYWSSFTSNVRAVDAELTNAELCLGTMCNRILEDVASNPDAFSITARRPDKSGQGRDYLDYQRFLNAGQGSPDRELYAGTEIAIVHSKLKNVAGMIETVGDHQRAVASKLGGTKVTVSSEWRREQLPGYYLGAGELGHFGNYEAVVDGLVDLLKQESDTAHRVAEHAFDISTRFALTDQQRETQLDGIAKQFDTVQ